MSREHLKIEASKVQNIVNTGKLNINGQDCDISAALGLWGSKEYRADDIIGIDITRYEKADKPCKYTLLPDGSDTVMFNSKYRTKDKRFLQKNICILNFASSKHPGGGFINGAMAQEEALCQASNLYDILSRHKDFYEYNRNNLNRGQYTDGIIFSKDCLFFRNKFKNCEPQLADVITCAAPNFKAARRNLVSVEEINNTMARRIEQILKVAIANNVRILALGAFGCGVFRNDVDFVANTMKTLLIDNEYDKYFDEIVFPMNESTGKNVSAFLRCFKKYI